NKVLEGERFGGHGGWFRPGEKAADPRRGTLARKALPSMGRVGWGAGRMVGGRRGWASGSFDNASRARPGHSLPPPVVGPPPADAPPPPTPSPSRGRGVLRRDW